MRSPNDKPETFCLDDLSKLPAALEPLTKEKRWVVWKWVKNKNGKWTKVPYKPHEPDQNAANDNPKTWGTFKEAVAVWKAGRADGIGFNLLDSERGAIDLDKCRDPETEAIAEWAQAILDRSPPDAYVEITVSGSGLRVIGATTGPKLQRKFTVNDGPGQYELFRSCGRYITISGLAFPERGERALANIDTVLDELEAEGDANKKAKKRGPGRPKGSKNKRELPRHLLPLLTADDPGPNKAVGDYQKRSAALFALLKLALAAGLAEDALVEVILDESRFKGKAIYEHCLKSGGEDYLRRQIARAAEEDLESKDGRKIIQIISGKLPQNVKAIERAIKTTDKCPVYRRGRHLVEPLFAFVHDPQTNRLVLETWLRPLNVPQLGNLVQKQAVEFQRWDKTAEIFAPVDWTSAQPILETLLDLQHADLPKVKGIITSPTMRGDGSLITAEGYDEATQLWHRKSPDLELPSIPEKPTRNEALNALKVFDDLFSEFQFAEKGNNKSVALAAILTAVLRAAFSNAPLLLFTAPEPRTGKSYLCLLISMIATGWPTIPTAGSRNTEEMEKRIETALLTGRQILYLNNLPDAVALTSVSLEQIASEGVVTIRKLGKLEDGLCDCRGATTVLLNGNNVTVSGALSERTLTCRLDAKMENPGERQFTHNPIQSVIKNRGAYLAAAFTIARAYIAAGSPKIEAKPFAGFDSWSRVVRDPLIWLGVPDPVATIESARALDPVRQELRALKNALLAVVGEGKNFDAAYLEGMANTYRPPPDNNPQSRPVLAWPELHQALLNTRGKIAAKSIGRKLMDFLDRIVDGYRIELVGPDPKRANTYVLKWCGEGPPPKRAKPEAEAEPF
jgi:putative DNA primase/helicase